MNTQSPNASPTDQIAAVELPKATSIPFEVFSKKLNRTTKLINSQSPDNAMKGRNDWFRFSLDEPVFATEISVFADGYEYKDCQFSWSSAKDGHEHKTSAEFRDGMFTFKVNALIDGFAFKPDTKYLGTVTISKVVASGFTMPQLDAALGQLNNLASVKKSALASAQSIIDEAAEKELFVSGLKDTIAQLDERIAEQRTEQSTGSKTLTNLQLEVEKYQETISKLTTDSTSFEARIEQQQATIETRQSEREQLNKDIAERTSELKSLENNIYLFPSEIEEFAKKGGQDKNFYWKLAAAPIGILAVLTLALIKNAADLSTVLNEPDNARILSIFITRMPYVIVSGAIIAVTFKLASSLITQIMRIDTQTRALAKLSIVATDISAASTDNLELTGEEIYHLRTGLKMDLLRDHLKTYISDDYQYLDSERVKTRLSLLKQRRTTQMTEPEPSTEANDSDEVAT